jgi:uncharacterized protein
MKKLLLVTLALLSAACVSAAGNPKPIKALLVTGGGSHDYEAQTKTLTEGLSKRLNIDITVAKEGTDREHKHSLYQNADWAKGYDVIIHNECFGMVADKELVERVAAPHKAGVPAVILHASMHSYRMAPTDEWRQVMGQRSMRHAARQDLTVNVVDTNHPVMSGFPQTWDDPQDELYVTEKSWPTIVPLAKARLKAPKPSKEPKDATAEPVVIWLNTYGKGRSFVTTLGHHDDTMKRAEYLDLVARGLLWSIGKLKADGTAEAGYAAAKK